MRGYDQIFASTGCWYSAGAVASAKKFNTLMQRIGKQHNLLLDWEAAIALFRQRHTSEIEPLKQQEAVLKEQQLRLFDSFSHQKFAKADKAHLAMLICCYVDEVLAFENDVAKVTELKAIFNRHSDIDYDQEQAQIAQEQDALMREMAQQMYGVQFAGDEPATPDAVLQKLVEKMQQAASEQSVGDHLAEDEWDSSQRGSKPRAKTTSKAAGKNGAKALKQQEAQKQVSQSVREIYRKLASSLHPDRETDPAERDRKTELMQRVNQAYAAGQLLQLLELQLEIEQINPAHLASLSDERLKHYNQVLEGQWHEIKMEVELAEDAFKADFGLSPLVKLSPKKLSTMAAAEVMDRKKDIALLGRQLEAFTQEPSLFKGWLKEDRQFHKQQESLLIREGGFFY